MKLKPLTYRRGTHCTVQRGSRDGSVDQPVEMFQSGLKWWTDRHSTIEWIAMKISGDNYGPQMMNPTDLTTIRWIAIKFVSDIHGAQRMNCNHYT